MGNVHDLKPPGTIESSLKAVEARSGKMPDALRTALFVLASAAAVAVCLVHISVAAENTHYAAGIGYLCLTLVLLGCAIGFWARSLAARGTLKIRWTLIAGAALIAGIGYVPSFSEYILHTSPQRELQTACFNASEALYLLAAVLFFSQVARAIVILDVLQALLFVVLRFNMIYSRTTPDHFTGNHLVVGQVMALCLFLVALVACLGAATRAELNFLRTLSWFFGLRLVTFFMANQVSYTWLHYSNSSEWEVPGILLTAGFALYLIYTSQRVQTAASEPTQKLTRSIVVRNLMPSFLALVDVMLGLFLTRISPRLAFVGIALALMFYMTRVVLLQVRALEEKTDLEYKNRQLEGLATCDPLTGIGNRRSLAGVYGRLQATMGETSLSLLLIDVDHFKQANDLHGHLHGDKVLIALAKKLGELSANLAGSHCARFGGDEFALLLVNAAPNDAGRLAEELCLAMRAHAWEAEGAEVTLSVGVASLFAVRDLSLDALISYADKALYRAKLLGRNCVESQPVWGAESVPEVVSTKTLRLEWQ